MFSFSAKSKERLATCDTRLQLVLNRAIEVSKIDFGIAEVIVLLNSNKRIIRPEKSKFDGINQQSKHQSLPSKAVDIYGFVNGKMNYDIATMSYLAGVIQAVGLDLGIDIRWGGNWDQDTEILTDQEFDDTPHFEL